MTIKELKAMLDRQSPLSENLSVIYEGEGCYKVIKDVLIVESDGECYLLLSDRELKKITSSSKRNESPKENSTQEMK